MLTSSKKFALYTAKLFVSLYPWFYMRSSVHKILIHGASVISASLLPIGMMSEEVQESRNKHLKQYREHRSRKMSREQMNSDVINRLLITSDPLISFLRELCYVKKSRKRTIPAEVIALLDDKEHLAKRVTAGVSSDSDFDEE